MGIHIYPPPGVFDIQITKIHYIKYQVWEKFLPRAGLKNVGALRAQVFSDF